MNWLWLISHDDALSDNDHVREDLKRHRLVLRLTALTILIFLLWASWAQIDQITRAPGSVIASSKTQIIQSEEAGSLEKLLVKEGDVVRRGDVLAQLDNTEALAGYREAKAKQYALLATLHRLEAEVFNKKLTFGAQFEDYPRFTNNQSQLYKKRQKALNEELGALDHMASLARKELSLNKPLLASGHVSETEVLRLERQLADIEAQKTNTKNQFFRDAQAEMNTAQEELSLVEQNLVQRERRLAMTQLKAPVDGVVKNIRTTTSGAVLRASEELMEIVPSNDALIVEAKVSPADIAFLKTGLPVTVKIDAFDYTIFGDLSGTLTYISADTLIDENQQKPEPYYRIQVKTDENRFRGKLGEALTILPGMTSSVEVITGTNTVLSYIIKPLIKTMSESLGER